MKQKLKLSKEIRVGVLSGGNSSERKISRKSGRAVRKALKNLGYQVSDLDPAKRERFRRQLKQIDVAFIALHGRGGEDGEIQKRLEEAKIPYVGSGAEGSRNAFDKFLSKKIFSQKKIPTAEFILLSEKNWERETSNLTHPLFVKPLRDGSSIGVFEFNRTPEDVKTLRRSLEKYRCLLAEKKIVGREFTVGVLGSTALPVIELRPQRKFYDYKAKYTSGMTRYLVPAPISGSLRKKLQKIARAAHRALGLRDFSRVDIMIDKKHRPNVLEANSIPGFTELSLLPKAAREAGISFEALCQTLLKMALARKK